MARQFLDAATGNKIEIVTDGKWRSFKYGYDVPERIRVGDFDWLDDGEGVNGFICYRRRWHHLSEFMRIDDKASPLHADGWQGVYNDSFSSGIVIKVASNGESYKIARFFC